MSRDIAPPARRRAPFKSLDTAANASFGNCVIGELPSTTNAAL